MSKQKTNARTLCTRANFPETSFCLYFATNANVIDSPVINIVQESTKKQNCAIYFFIFLFCHLSFQDPPQLISPVLKGQFQNWAIFAASLYSSTLFPESIRLVKIPRIKAQATVRISTAPNFTTIPPTPVIKITLAT